MISSLFQKNFAVEMISVQRMRRLSRKEPIYLAVIRTTNDIENEDIGIDPNSVHSVKQSTVIVNESQDPDKLPQRIAGYSR